MDWWAVLQKRPSLLWIVGVAVGGYTVGVTYGFKLGYLYAGEELDVRKKREQKLREENETITRQIYQGITPFKEGTLDMRHKKLFSIWRTRHVTLRYMINKLHDDRQRQGLLSYFKRRRDGQLVPGGHVLLDEYTVTELDPKDAANKENCFQISGSATNEELQFCAKTKEDFQGWLEALKHMSGLSSHRSVLSFEYPRYWNPPFSKMQQTKLNPDSDEYKEVESLFKSTMTKAKNYKDFKVLSITRVQNPDLWKRYSITREGIIMENGTANERLLFHGTSSSAINKIIEEGFDHRVSGNGMFGQGIYFAENSTKSHGYTGLVNTYQMLLCRVTLGNEYVCLYGQSFRRPPQNWWSYKKYHSVVGDSKKYNPKAILRNREFIVYNNYQAYPEYIITYKVVR